MTFVYTALGLVFALLLWGAFVGPGVELPRPEDPGPHSHEEDLYCGEGW